MLVTKGVSAIGTFKELPLCFRTVTVLYTLLYVLRLSGWALSKWPSACF
jgi:hypothetical protein